MYIACRLHCQITLGAIRAWAKTTNTALIELGNNRMEKIGFSSPKPETQGITMYEIARQNNIKLPRKRDDAVKVLVRTLAIERIKELDKTAVDNYTDLNKNSSK